MDAKEDSLCEFMKRLTSASPALMTSVKVMRLPKQTGVIYETNEDTYDHFLDALPVHYMQGSLFCFGEGYDPFTLFFRRNGRYFMRRLTEEETEMLCRMANIPRAVYT
jgi:hypothetical protein